MSIRERRSLWGSISTSKKVNALSDRALILYVFTIPHLDDEGFIDADPKTLKSTSVPLRDNIQIKDIRKLIEEITTVHSKTQSTPVPLWKLHKTAEGDYIEDPVFNERQSFKGIRKRPSKIKDVIDMETLGKQKGEDRETKGFIREEEEKEKEKDKGKRSECEGARNTPMFPIPKTSVQQFQDLFNTTTQYLPKVSDLGKSRSDKIKARMKENNKDDLSWWKLVFEKADMILLPGKSGKKDWFPTFDWLIENDRNAVKVFEGNYDDAKRPLPFMRPQPGIAAFLKSKMEQDNDS